MTQVVLTTNEYVNYLPALTNIGMYTTCKNIRAILIHTMMFILYIYTYIYIYIYIYIYNTYIQTCNTYIRQADNTYGGGGHIHARPSQCSCQPIHNVHNSEQNVS